MFFSANTSTTVKVILKSTHYLIDEGINLYLEDT
jgi:hypothetical protein